MSTFSGLVIGLSLVSGFLLLALVAELYYLLWWKKRIVNTEGEDEDCRNHAKDLLSLLSWRRPSSGSDPDGNGREREVELGSGKDLVVKTFGEEGIESELMRVHNLAGPPRFLFTIKEETKEDLETYSVKSRSRSLSDLVMTPLSSPIKTSPCLLGNLNHNPLFDCSETELTSPPPKFKFLRDAEEKLLRRSKNGHQDSEGKDESFVTIIVSKNNREQQQQQQQQQQQRCGCNVVPPQKCPSSSSQVLPLPSSPKPNCSSGLSV